MSDLDQLVAKAASATLSNGAFSRVMLAPTSDSDGRDAWHVVVVLNHADVSGGEALDTMVSIQDALVASGDVRFPIIDFATEDELKADVGSGP